MYDNITIEKTKKLLNSILEKHPDECLSNSKELFAHILGQHFANEIDKNGILRYNSLKGSEENAPYWGVLYENATQSGTYENFSLVLFPDNLGKSEQILLCFGIGTGGITDDAELLNVPWVKRSLKLLLKFVKTQSWNLKNSDTFVKDDIIDEYTEIPDSKKYDLANFFKYSSLWKKYGKYLPTACVIEADENGARAFLSHLLFYAKLRNWSLKKEFQNILDNKIIPGLINLWRTYPKIEEVAKYLLERKYIILQGPPGTGKTYLSQKIAESLKNNEIKNFEIIQFHSSVSYEDFVEGIRPDTKSNQLIFKEQKGPFLDGINKALECKNEKKGYLLIIDEINRGDLSKILGEAIFLFEPGEEREVRLRSGKKIVMPNNFYVIGTMNTADRTIAILDFAIRRRFAFIDVLPSAEKLMEILENNDEEVKNYALHKFNELQNIFFQYATDEELNLQPGHTYFISNSKASLINRLKFEIVPLLKEYLNEGRLTMAKNEIHAFIEKILEG